MISTDEVALERIVTSAEQFIRSYYAGPTHDAEREMDDLWTAMLVGREEAVRQLRREAGR